MIAATVLLPRVEPVNERTIAMQIEHYLVEPNVLYLQEYGGALPPLYECSLRYAEDPDEVMLTIPYLLASEEGDCEDFVAALVAEDRVSRRIDSRVLVVANGDGGYHALVRRPVYCGVRSLFWDRWSRFSRYVEGFPAGTVIDPSLRFGMR